MKGFGNFEAKMNVCFCFYRVAVRELIYPGRIGFDWSESYLLAKAYYLEKQAKREYMHMNI